MNDDEFRKQISYLAKTSDNRAWTNEELRFREEIKKFGPFLDLCIIFTDFVGKTTTSLAQLKPLNINDEDALNHRIFFQNWVHSFKILRAAEIISHNGYCFQGFTLMRNAYDDIVLTLGVIHKLATNAQVLGLNDEHNLPDEKISRKIRKDTETLKIRPYIDGSKSGLSLKTLDVLQKYNNLFDTETHGGRLSKSENYDWLRGIGPLSLTPEYSDHQWASFMNRYTEIAWMLHRLLPLVQMDDRHLNDHWKSRWKEIDQCFEYLASSLITFSGNRAGEAIKEFVNTKLNFNENSTYPFN